MNNAVLASFLAGLSLLCVTSAALAQRQSRVLTDGWRFAKGEHPAAAEAEFDDAAWRDVRLPHDWAIAGPFDPDGDAGTGKLPWRGVGWYRTNLDLPAVARGKRVLLVFDGVMASPSVFLNGEKVGGWTYGYTGFVLDATHAAQFGGPNVLAVRADTTHHGSRWYPGAGIYRKVTLLLVDPVHVPVWGQFVTTPAVSDAAATVNVSTEVANDAGEAREVHCRVELLDPEGRVLAEEENRFTMAPGETTFDARLTIDKPRRWDVDSPTLYTARTTVRVNGEAVDQVETSFGVRTFEFTADDGFHLNGRRLLLHGVNLHHDQGPLGAAFFPDAAERQLRLMKDMGVNALRTSHNPPAPEVLEWCDRLGIVVWDELFDKWDRTAGFGGDDAAFVRDFAPPQVEAFVRRDRNHPSVVIWSIGNEIPSVLTNADGREGEHVAAMVNLFKHHDPTRPVTMGMHMTQGADPALHLLDALDVQGWNYSAKYRAARVGYPNVPMVYAESASAFSNRGEYVLPPEESKTAYSPEFKSSSYDRTAASWADIPDVEFERMLDDRSVAGEFVWTGFDYLGEPTPFGDGPDASRSSYFGIVDLAGLPKDRYFLYRSHWLPGETTVHVLPHWTWPERVGQVTPVYVYTNGDSAELFLNGKSLGRRHKRGGDAPAESGTNLASGMTAAASSEQVVQDAGGNVKAENLAARALDGSADSRWCAADATLPQWWQVDLKQARPVRSVRLTFEHDAADYAYALLGSDDGRTWHNLAASPDARTAGRQASFRLQDARPRFVRVNVTAVRGGGWAGLREVELSDQQDVVARSTYYEPTERFRLMWDDVTYKPGELRAVAYTDGKEIGETSVKTAGEPAALRLTPERPTLTGGGVGLAYVKVEAVDAEGNVCPRDAHKITFTIDGPATLAAVGNGDPRSYEPYQDAEHSLFYGAAVLILRGETDARGPVTITARADGLESATTTVAAE